MRIPAGRSIGPFCPLRPLRPFRPFSPSLGEARPPLDCGEKSRLDYQWGNGKQLRLAGEDLIQRQREARQRG